VPVKQARSGLLPGLSRSFGPEVNQNRTWLDVPREGSPSSSNTRAVRVTVSPMDPVPCSGPTSRYVGTPAATAIRARKGVAGATDSAQMAADTNATNNAVRKRFDRFHCSRM
jgi:hypothetical protein